MTVDYAAAHSMDTTWFAVDGKGQVGCFETGSDGAVPASWAFMPVALWLDPTWRSRLPPVIERVDSRGLVVMVCPSSTKNSANWQRHLRFLSRSMDREIPSLSVASAIQAETNARNP